MSETIEEKFDSLSVSEEEHWNFKTYVLFANGYRHYYDVGPHTFEDEFGNSIGFSFKTEVIHVSDNIDSSPVASCIDFWLERTTTIVQNNEFETKHVITNKLHKQTQSTKNWWICHYSNQIRNMLKDSNSVSNNIVTKFENHWNWR